MELAELAKIIQKIEKNAQTPVYAVGGFVRDLVMGNPQKKDIDFVVVGSGLAFAKLFDEAMSQAGSLIEFSDFDTARYVMPAANEEDTPLVLEFAGARTETYQENSRKPAVTEAS